MKRSKLTGLAVSAASVLFATGLTACGGADASKGDATKAQSNNVLVYAGEAEKMINPLLNTHGELETIVFSGLTKYDGSGKPIEVLLYQRHQCYLQQGLQPVEEQMLLREMQQKLSLIMCLYMQVKQRR